MSTPLDRSSDHVVDAFLEEGPIRMSDRLFDAIVDDVYRTRQWGLTAPWRSFLMQRSAFAAAVIVVAIAVAGTALVLLRPNDSDVATKPSMPPPTAPISPVPAIGPSLPPAGANIDASTFTEPFTFVMPAFPDDGSTPVSGALMNGGYALSSSTWGVVSFHDDVPLPADMCRPSGPSIDDVPATPADVGRWLESATGLMVSAPTTLAVDGRSATIWDVQTGGHCDARGSRAPFFGPDERHRVYAVPTDKDTVLVFTWGVDWGNGSEGYLDQVNAATDELVRSIRFGSTDGS
jgi:hypothetical protein